jgi:hypothetical protein
MCLPNFIEYKEVLESNPIIGYRSWQNSYSKLDLKSLHQNYIWKAIEGPHLVLERDSGIYSYNYYCYNYYYYNYYYNEYYNRYNRYNNNYNYIIGGIIHQWGKVAVHENGYRSEYAKIIKLFTIRKSDAEGPENFLDWIDRFNKIIESIAEKYNCTTISWQDFLESQKTK